MGHKKCLDALLAAGAALPHDWECGDAKPKNVSYRLGKGFAMVVATRPPDGEDTDDTD